MTALAEPLPPQAGMGHQVPAGFSPHLWGLPGQIRGWGLSSRIACAPVCVCMCVCVCVCVCVRTQAGMQAHTQACRHARCWVGPICGWDSGKGNALRSREWELEWGTHACTPKLPEEPCSTNCARPGGINHALSSSRI